MIIFYIFSLLEILNMKYNKKLHPYMPYLKLTDK